MKAENVQRLDDRHGRAYACAFGILRQTRRSITLVSEPTGWPKTRASPLDNTASADRQIPRGFSRPMLVMALNYVKASQLQRYND